MVVVVGDKKSVEFARQILTLKGLFIVFPTLAILPCFSGFSSLFGSTKEHLMTPTLIATICETIMVICFGVSWPLAIYKSIKSRSAKGKSPYFTMAIITGYVAIIIGKIVVNEFDGWLNILKFVLYIVNLLMVSTDLCLYYRNRKFDLANEKAQA